MPSPHALSVACRVACRVSSAVAAHGCATFNGESPLPTLEMPARPKQALEVTCVSGSSPLFLQLATTGSTKLTWKSPPESATRVGLGATGPA
ncbi:hypothetical protein PF005_g16175 [Phytophthora fragariae]|uniref:Uncharacterized protein n=1 Tax=Phytophthora fragariae TaxID=53985 RepID=A0A6A3YA15_9STRA|nr:hypothetical protein PF003_g37324 [Phytophthora fragariae]KAE8932374.1 hypothetical protein PF009_g17592 [Phytophthora fragariae]KAE8997085.1 hypothetical protein PF011_g15636 [Phytophthora fragariae]KAE9097126.1 hypothetical protein PF010_g16083 [Phytophthora fragariae]KAE9097853.1 hypothetical protein PF007_g16470 [Phytophthora fragariae]